MLVLTRRVGEAIVIADNIRLKVVAIDGKRVRIGIRLPSSIRVDRAEVHDRRKADHAPRRNDPDSPNGVTNG
jgi:carbon storage regulator